MTTPRLQPKPDPRSREEWRVEVVDERTESGLVLFEYAVRAKAGDDPFILNNHRAQLRTNHQRIVTGPNGGLMHVSGAEVLDVDEFAKDARFYRWQDKDRNGRWRADDGRVLAPYMFTAAPWAGGGDEEIDPQWARERFTLTLAEQRDDAVGRFLDRAALKGWEGDKRGTTLNLQVGASADDAWQDSADNTAINQSASTVDDVAEHIGCRFQAVTIAPGSTITSAIFMVTINGSSGDEPQHQVKGQAVDDAAAFSAGTGNNDIDARSRTTATVQWDSADLGNSGGTFQEWGCSSSGGAGANVGSIIQEIVDRGGWVSGNSLALIFEQHTLDALRDLGMLNYDSSSAVAAKLDIDYTAAAGNAMPMAMNHYRRMRG